MTPFERLRVAWASPDREGQLNLTVETMAAEGVTREQLDQAIALLLKEVRASGADDPTEEIINSVADRLHGWCHPTRQINTVPITDKLSRSPH